jgi:hypothetical protein
MNRGLGLAVGLALLSPGAISAAPILLGGDSFCCAGISGWANEHGNFAVDFDGAMLVSGSAPANYSTTSSVFSLHTGLFSLLPTDGPPLFLHDGHVFLDVIVQGDGTIGGNLTVLAPAAGVPEAGVSGDEVLLVGHPIDAAALPSPAYAWNTLFLFSLSYKHPALATLGDYVTWQGPYAGLWGGVAAPFDPWGRDTSASGGFTLSDFVRTTKVGEPNTFALVCLGAVVLTRWQRRRQALRHHG